MRVQGVLLLLGIMIFIVGCGAKSDAELFYEAQKQLYKMETYQCEVEITSIGNKNPQKYIMKQWFKKPNKYKLEVLYPENLKGKVTISDGKMALIYHPGIDQTWITQNFANSEEQNMFLGYFVKNCLDSESVELAKETVDGEEYLMIHTDIPGNHVYYNKEVLWLHVKTMKPFLLRVFDIKDQLRIEVKYNQFQYNPNLRDEMFRLNIGLS